MAARMHERPDVPLIGLAHGSRHASVRASIDSLMAAAAAEGGMPAVSAFLDLTQPDLTATATDLAAQGHTRAVVVPLLFTEAFHAQVDVPEAVRQAAGASGMDLVIADILGTGDDMLEVVHQSMRDAGIGGVESVLLLSVGSSNSAANDAVADLANRLGRGRSGEVHPAFGTRSPRAKEVLPGLAEPVAIVPLFVSPGLLLDPLARLAAERGMVMAPPLGDLVASVLLDRYRTALARPAEATSNRKLPEVDARF